MPDNLHEMIVGYIKGAIDEAVSRIEYAKSRTERGRTPEDTALLNKYLTILQDAKKNAESH